MCCDVHISISIIENVYTVCIYEIEICSGMAFKIIMNYDDDSETANIIKYVYGNS